MPGGGCGSVWMERRGFASQLGRRTSEGASGKAKVIDGEERLEVGQERALWAATREMEVPPSIRG